MSADYPRIAYIMKTPWFRKPALLITAAVIVCWLGVSVVAVHFIVKFW